MAEKEHYEMEDLSPQAIKALRNALSCGNINLNDVLQWDEDMRKKKSLQNINFLSLTGNLTTAGILTCRTKTNQTKENPLPKENGKIWRRTL